MVKLFVCLLVIGGLIDIARRGYILFTNHNDPIKNTIIFLAEIGLWFWLASVLRRRKYKYSNPKFKLVFVIILAIFIVSAFAGIQPLSTFKDKFLVTIGDIVESVGNDIEERHSAIVTKEATKESSDSMPVIVEPPTIIPVPIPPIPELAVTPVPTPKATNDPAKEQQGIDRSNYVAMFNEYRQSHGLNPLEFTNDLERIAELRLVEIQAHFSHYSKGNYNEYLAENIVVGVSNNEEALSVWKNSLGHNANMLDREYRNTGYAMGDGYAIQVFSPWETVNGEPQLAPGWDFAD